MFEVNDKVFSILHGEGKVEEIKNDIVVVNIDGAKYEFDKEGKLISDGKKSKAPVLFKSKPTIIDNDVIYDENYRKINDNDFIIVFREDHFVAGFFNTKDKTLLVDTNKPPIDLELKITDKIIKVESESVPMFFNKIKKKERREAKGASNAALHKDYITTDENLQEDKDLRSTSEETNNKDSSQASKETNNKDQKKKEEGSNLEKRYEELIYLEGGKAVSITKGIIKDGKALCDMDAKKTLVSFEKNVDGAEVGIQVSFVPENLEAVINANGNVEDYITVFDSFVKVEGDNDKLGTFTYVSIPKEQISFIKDGKRVKIIIK